MKVSSSISVAVFSTVAVSGVVDSVKVTRQIDTVNGVLNDVGSGIGDLDSAVSSYNGGDSGPVVDAAEALVSTIGDGVSTVEGSEDLSLEDALGLQDPVADLTDQASALVDNLTGKRDLIAENGECGTTRGLISEINSSSNQLIDAVVSKVPEDAQTIAEGLASDLQDVLAEAQENFSESNCVDSEDGGDDGDDDGGDDEPTGEPTGEPTAEPTEEPTGMPTEEPTGMPTEEPTGMPTEEPTGEPTGMPTEEPTAEPTMEPTGVIPPPGGNGTETDIPPVPTAAAGALLPAGALAVGIAAAIL